MGGETVSLFALELDAALESWRARPISEMLRKAPTGRMATLVTTQRLDASRPGSAAPQTERVSLFDAMIDDLSIAALWDAPIHELDDALAALGVSLEGTALTGVAEAEGRYVRWLSESGKLTRARLALEKALEQPTVTELERDLLETLAPVLEAGTVAGMALVVQR